jgi:hypothetical protein
LVEEAVEVWIWVVEVAEAELLVAWHMLIPPTRQVLLLVRVGLVPQRREPVDSPAVINTPYLQKKEIIACLLPLPL